MLAVFFKQMNAASSEDLEKKFVAAYFIAKHEISMRTFPSLLSLNERLGVEITQSYRNSYECGEFIDAIAEVLSKYINHC